MTAEMFSLLTRIQIPGGSRDLSVAAKQQHLFPLVGLVVGLCATLLTVALDAYLGKELVLVSAGLLVVAMYSITGILHTEGLADFSDGMMASGTQERKREAMKDVHTGVGGAFALFLYLLLFFALASVMCSRAGREIDPMPWPWTVTPAIGFVISEMAGKLAMNTTIFLGPSSHAGMGAVFVESASARKLLAAMGLACAVGVLVAGVYFAIVLTGVLAGVAVTMTARKHFGGVAGDAFGTANEIGRLVALFAWVLIV